MRYTTYVLGSDGIVYDLAKVRVPLNKKEWLARNAYTAPVEDGENKTENGTIK